ncbi:FtsX-like permease family protein [Paenibacillus donghaensis]|uniref:ABC3 transporter permease C-terminal domain-containing protein n=1 Tax=Paenibacillus donghaensis TaxID=414771 RepID=A0A2Z2KBD6_9BACL|nr:FtsX-like permease family protein [Paenibacillus donghaensis]ASA23024.1 hypothetical protein B9T62_20765 [Paenibacillus donghaensis]
MIRSIRGLALRFFWRNPSIAAASVFSIALSVFVIITMFMYLFGLDTASALEQNQLIIQTRFVGVLAVILLLCTALLIASNFQLFMYAYKQQFAVMRAMGAKTGDLFMILLIQTTLMNVVGALIGYLLSMVAGAGVHRLMNRIYDVPLPSAAFDHLSALLIMGGAMLLIELFILVPVLRNSRILPLQVIQLNEDGDFRSVGPRGKGGKVVLALALLFFVYAKVMAPSEGAGALALLLSVLAVVLGLALLFPLYIAGMFRRILPAVERLGGRTSLVAVKNMIPQIRRNSFAILTVSSMMLIMVFGSSILHTFQVNEESFLAESFPAPIVMEYSGNREQAPSPEQLKPLILEQAGVAEASFVSISGSLADLYVDGRYHWTNTARADMSALMKQGLLPELELDKEISQIIISQSFADQYQLIEGSVIELGRYSVPDQHRLPVGQAQVAYIAPEFSFTPADVLIDWQDARFFNNTTYRFLVTPESNGQIDQVRTALQQEFSSFQTSSYEDTLQQSRQMFYQNWSFFILVIVTVIIGVIIGVFSTLISNIYAKRKEYAILRTLSVNGKGVVQIILTQILLYLSMGLGFGALLGLLMTYSMWLLDGNTKLYVDYPSLLMLSAGIIGLAVVVFILYGRHIARQNLARELLQQA